MGYECDGFTNCSWCAKNRVQKVGKKNPEGTGNQRKNREHPDHYNFKIGLKSSGDLKRHGFTQTPERALAETGVKNLQEVKQQQQQ